MFCVTYDLSQPTHPNYYLYNNLLSTGWIFDQYSQFRNHLPLLFALACIYLMTSHVYKYLTITTKGTLYQTYFYLVASVLVILALHGTSCIKILVIITTSFMIGQFAGASYWNPLLTWTFNLVVLFCNEYYKGYKFESIGFASLVKRNIYLSPT
jgi:hypothetical protein